ncbi:ParA family protein [Nonlabens sp.]|uniref:ParA family protein n=1 Tax=Nonlabens sp. TaxID=1888209 RepID=UPI003F69F989
MSKVISVCNLKGGVGKTTTAVNLSAALGQLKFKTLIIDTDPQANASMALGHDAVQLHNPNLQNMDFYSVLRYQILKTSAHNVDLVPYFEDFQFFNQPTNKGKFKKLIEQLKVIYDYIIIDCIPSLQTENFEILAISNSVIVPVQCDYYAVNALYKTLEAVSYSSKNFNKDLKVEGFLITMYLNSTNLSKKIKKCMEEHFENLVFKTEIRRSASIVHAQSIGKSILDHAPQSTGAKDYLKLAKEIISKNKDIKIKESAIVEKEQKQPKQDTEKHNELYDKIINSVSLDNTSKKHRIALNDFSKLVSLNKNEIEQIMGTYEGDYTSSVWIYKLTNVRGWFKKKYLYLYFHEGHVNSTKRKRFYL